MSLSLLRNLQQKGSTVTFYCMLHVLTFGKEIKNDTELSCD
jgi:hypothetical protein